jgi:hypothetical protein
MLPDVFKSVSAVLSDITGRSPSKVSLTLLLVTLVFYLKDKFPQTRSEEYCLIIAPSIIEPLPYLGDLNAFHHSLHSRSLFEYALQSLALLILGNFLEPKLGALVLALILVMADLLVAFLALALAITQCYGSLGLWPSLTASAVLLHAENPRIFPNGGRNVPVEVRWVVWSLIFTSTLLIEGKDVYQLVVAAFVGWTLALTFHSDARRGLIRSVRFHKLQVLRALVLFVSVHVLPWTFAKMPRSVSDVRHFSSPPLYGMIHLIVHDFVSKLAMCFFGLVVPSLLTGKKIYFGVGLGCCGVGLRDDEWC